MNCINCNTRLPEDATECPFCGAKVTGDVIRCPKCFVKLKKDAKLCPKCGFDIEKAERNSEEVQKNNKTNKKRIFVFLLVFLLCIALAAAANSAWYSARYAEFKSETADFMDFVDENIENITILAGGYNKIYKGDWIIYAENISALEETNEAAIAALVDNRDEITYMASEVSKKGINNNDKQLVNNVFEIYNDCYLYVVGKKGSPSGYMKGYEDLLSQYNKCCEMLKKRIK